MNGLPMSDCAKAYLAEYGSMPRSRDEQDRYSAFRFGYEAGHKQGRKAQLERQKAVIEASLEQLP